MAASIADSDSSPAVATTTAVPGPYKKGKHTIYSPANFPGAEWGFEPDFANKESLGASWSFVPCKGYSASKVVEVKKCTLKWSPIYKGNVGMSMRFKHEAEKESSVFMETVDRVILKILHEHRADFFEDRDDLETLTEADIKKMNLYRPIAPPKQKIDKEKLATMKAERDKKIKEMKKKKKEYELQPLRTHWDREYMIGFSIDRKSKENLTGITDHTMKKALDAFYLERETDVNMWLFFPGYLIKKDKQGVSVKLCAEASLVYLCKASGLVAANDVFESLGIKAPKRNNAKKRKADEEDAEEQNAEENKMEDEEEKEETQEDTNAGGPPPLEEEGGGGEERPTGFINTAVKRLKKSVINN